MGPSRRVLGIASDHTLVPWPAELSDMHLPNDSGPTLLINTHKESVCRTAVCESGVAARVSADSRPGPGWQQCQR